MRDTREIKAHAGMVPLTRGRSPQMDRVCEAMEQLQDALYGLSGWPQVGNMGPVPQLVREMTLVVETGGIPNSAFSMADTYTLRWWPDRHVPPAYKVITPWQERGDQPQETSQEKGN